MGLLQALNLPAPRQPVAAEAPSPLEALAGSGRGADGPTDLNDPPPGAPPRAKAGDPPRTPAATPPRAQTPPTHAVPTPPAAVPGTPPVPKLSADAIAYANELKAIQALVKALNAHPEARSIARDLARITSKLASAGGHAAKAAWPAAMRDLADARALCTTAGTHAEKWKQFRTRKAVVAAMGTALEGLDKRSSVIAQYVTNAQAAADQDPPDFVEAERLLGQVDTALRPSFRADVDRIKGLLTALEGKDADVKAFLAAELTAGRRIVASLEAAFAAGEWSRLMAEWREGFRVLGGAERYAKRRTDYSTQRALTAAEVAAVKAIASVQARGPALDARMAEADRLGSYAVMQMEAGVAHLKATAVLCTALKNVAPSIARYATDRARADADLLALDQHAAAARLATQRKAIAGMLALAAAAAKQGAEPSIDPTVHWQAALAQLDRARADLAAALQLAASLATSVTVEAAAGGAPAAVRKALDALRADLDAVKPPIAPTAAPAFDLARSQAAAAGAALLKGDAATVKRTLAAAGQALARGHTLQAEHERFVTELKALEEALKALQSDAQSGLVAPRIAAVAKAIATARADDAAGKGSDAIAALRQGTDLLAQARQALADRKAYDVLAKKASDRIAAEVSDAKAKKPFAKALADATALADALDFAAANAALKQLQVKLGQAKLEAGMKSTPPDPKLRDIVKDIVANGGAAEVDKAIQNAPATDKNVITALASARFGKEFLFSGAGADADGDKEMVKSMKRCCEVFAKIADDVVDNPSISDITHEDATGTAGGGYTGSTAKIGMTGRVDAFQQKFGKDEENQDPATGRPVKALPANIDPDCLPPDGAEVEYLGFAAAHEVGHGVDDLRGFMNKYGAQEQYGGWIDHGGNVEPIADAVGAHIKSKHPSSTFYDTPASKKYVLDKLLNRAAERPPEASTGDPAFVVAEGNAYNAFDKWHATATSADVYRRQGDCDAIKLGSPERIYHEAYPRRWVSYLASARRKGLTGYQFRAPGEWFAELYAGWKSGRLGKKHPALAWLTKL